MRARPGKAVARPGVPMHELRAAGFSLVELLMVLVILSVLAALALPSYRGYVQRASRVAAQTELLQMASVQEKIFLNSQSYAYGASGVTAAYDGSASGGLGWSSGRTRDGQYGLSLVSLATDGLCSVVGALPTQAGAQAFVVMATPVMDGLQKGQASLCVSETGQRLWGRTAW